MKNRQILFKDSGCSSGLKFEYCELLSIASVRPQTGQLHKVCRKGRGLFRPDFSEI